MGSNNSLCWTWAIQRDAGRHHIPLIIAFVSLATLGFLYRRDLAATNWWEEDSYRRTCLEAAFAYFCFCVFTLEVCCDGFWVVNGSVQCQSPPSSLSTSSSHAQISTKNSKIKIKTFTNPNVSYNNCYFHSYIWIPKKMVK